MADEEEAFDYEGNRKLQQGWSIVAYILGPILLIIFIISLVKVCRDHKKLRREILEQQEGMTKETATKSRSEPKVVNTTVRIASHSPALSDSRVNVFIDDEVAKVNDGHLNPNFRRSEADTQSPSFWRGSLRKAQDDPSTYDAGVVGDEKRSPKTSGQQTDFNLPSGEHDRMGVISFPHAQSTAQSYVPARNGTHHRPGAESRVQGEMGKAEAQVHKSTPNGQNGWNGMDEINGDKPEAVLPPQVYASIINSARDYPPGEDVERKMNGAIDAQVHSGAARLEKLTCQDKGEPGSKQDPLIW